MSLARQGHPILSCLRRIFQNRRFATLAPAPAMPAFAGAIIVAQVKRLSETPLADLCEKLGLS
jgi:hypothetical protein